ncbi:MAG: hypothetical protein WC696_00350 [Candidatus Methylopumilus sp.]
MALENARQANRVFIARLEAQTIGLQNEVYPGRHPGPYKWLKIVRGLIATAQGYLTESENPAISDTDKSKLINDAAQIGQFSFGKLKDILGAEASELPHQVIKPLQRWLDDLKIKETVFFLAEHAPNYELRIWPKGHFSHFHHPAQSLTDALSEVEWPFTRITVPGRALGMLPYYALVAHEAGHAIYARVGLDLNANSQPQLQTLVDRVQARIGRSLTVNDTALSEIVTNWVEELAADAIAHFIAGPAFYFSAFGFFQMCTRGYGVGTSHPPHDLRRSVLYEQMLVNGAAGSSYAEIFQKHTGVPFDIEINSIGIPACSSGDNLFAVLQINYDVLPSSVMTEAIQYVTEIYPYIFKTVGDYLKVECPDLIYTPEKLDFDLTNHLEALCHLIPPIEFKEAQTGEIKPVVLSSILNVGWVALLTKLDQISVQPGQVGSIHTWQMERLHSLLIKAVELAEARRTWEEAV